MSTEGPGGGGGGAAPAAKKPRQFERGVFKKEELVTKTFNGKSTTYPVVGGRLRLLHEEHDALGIPVRIETEPRLEMQGECASVKVTVHCNQGTFTAHGTASLERDGNRMKHTLIELAETRGVARALRYAGYGVEFTGAEEMENVGPNAKGGAKVLPGSGTKTPSGNEPTPSQMGLLRKLKSEMEKASGEPVKMDTPNTKAEASKAIDDLQEGLKAYQEAKA